MNFILILIICVLVNVLSKYVYKFIEELRNIKKVKNNVNNIDYEKILNGLDKDFWNNFDKDDINNEK